MIPLPDCVRDDAGHCITCSDEGVPLRVVSVPGDGLARCAGPTGEVSEVMTGLVGEVAPGDVLLVHAGAALARLPGEEAPR
ncbi:MAG TPA: HypC/HybG/HupF family hydrogenase formation chaperone [Longimicrobium sp.]|nr:HypC/HybG/HupF family hydrogenase formation chaperone [Longimicrobium sp.]